MTEEESFPRGGKIVRKRPPPDNENLFSISKPPKPKKKKKQTKKHVSQELSGDTFEATIIVRGSLAYNKIQTGMVILGCVRKIKHLCLEIELPGLCFASVNVTEISDSFTKNLSQQLENNESGTTVGLSDIFSVGEFLPVKIINVEAREKRTHVEGSVNPREIYSEQNHNSFKKEMLVWSYVVSRADHGYEMSLGVKNCRAFLPFKNVNDGTEYATGKPLWCIIHKVESSSSASVLRLSAKLEHIKSAKLDIESLHDIIPGIKVEFVVDKITSHGLQGKFSEKFIGYVDENYLKKPLKKTSDYQEGKLLTAYVLFSEPSTKITHLTLRFPEKEDAPDLKIGDIVQGEVFGKSSNGMFFILPNKLKGFTTNKRLMNTLGKKDNIDISESLNSKFSVGSKHKCRIIDYNHLTKTFICTPEFSVVKESTFAPTDLTPGQLIEVTIVNIKDEGIEVTTGRVRGFVQNLHITNTEYSHNVKKKFKQGQKIDARVLCVEDDKVNFTLKPALVENELCLSKVEDAEIGKKYPGVVSMISETGALVVFYGGVKGWISQKGMGYEATDPSRYFFLGQVVNIYVWRLEGSRIHLSLFRPQIKSSLPNVGGRHCGVVKAVTEHGIKIQIENSTRKGFIPNAHLSSSLSLCGAVKNTFKPGDKIQELMYVGGVKPQIFSRREGLAMMSEHVPKLETLEVGDIIRCSYQRSADEGIYVSPLIQDCADPVLVIRKDTGQKFPELKEHQLLKAKIEKIDSTKKKLSLSLELDDVFDKSVESVISLFTQYLVELSYLSQLGSSENWNICKYSPGDHVICKIEAVQPQGGCVVSLPNGAKGIAVPFLCPKSLKVGDTLPGVVISHDYERKFVDMCLKPDISGRINPLQDGNLKQGLASCIAEKLLVKDECVIAVLKHSTGNRQLIYLPVKLHENDFEGCMSYYEKKKSKVCVCGKMRNILIGMSKKMFLRLDKAAGKQDVKLGVSDKISKEKLQNTNKNPHSRKTEKRKKIDEISQSDDGIVSKDKRRKVDEISPTKKKKEKHVQLEPPIETSEVSQTKKTKGKIPASDSDSGFEPENINDIEIESEDEEQLQNNVKDNDPASTAFTLPGVPSLFQMLKKDPVVDESSSDDEDNGPTEKKKKKLTPAERAELIRQEEERISKIEKELADPTRAPESADQFDRLLVAKPDSAELWAKYIAFHIAATEIDKARAVAKRALDTINMTLTEEKFKIWMVLLNLETMFGTKESFDKTFEDALKYNDPLQVYLKVIQMLAENAKYNEMEEKISKLKPKYKQDPTMWMEIGKTYYQIGKFKEARNCKDKALLSITDKKSQMNIIVRFAIMEFKYGEEDQGCAIFEAILTSDPRKVNIWITYVDQLVKKGRIDEARQVLERSVCQKLPLKSMKSLFMKFRKFEEEHGTPETVEAVKQRAQDYVVKYDK